MIGSGEENSWHPQQEELLAKWSEMASGYRYLHSLGYKKYTRLHMYFSLPCIILSTLAGTANFSTGSFPEQYQSYVPLITGAIGLLSGAITTVAQFCRVPEQMEGHRAASIDYGKLARSIEVELALPESDRKSSGSKFTELARKELERLQSTSPDIPLQFVKQFDKRFKRSGIAMPEILRISKVQIYREKIDDDELKRQKDAELEMLKLETAKAFQNHVETAAAKMQKDRHIRRKNTVSASSISSSMERLISTIHEKRDSLAEACETPLPPETTADVDDSDSTPTVCSLGSEDDGIDGDPDIEKGVTTSTSPFAPPS